MSDFASTSHNVALGLSPGEHSFSDARLLQVYGISRVTPIGRAEIAARLREAGLEIRSDPAEAPLVVRKPRVEAAPGAPARIPFYRRPGVVGVGIVAIIVLLAALLAPEFRTQPVPLGGGSGTSAGTAGTATGGGSGVVGTAPAGRGDPRNLIPAAEALVREDAYVQALALVAALPSGDRDRIGRAVSRRLAERVQSAVRRGDRATARRLIAEAARYPATTESAAARSALSAAGD